MDDDQSPVHAVFASYPVDGMQKLKDVSIEVSVRQGVVLGQDDLDALHDLIPGTLPVEAVVGAVAS